MSETQQTGESTITTADYGKSKRHCKINMCKLMQRQKKYNCKRRPHRKKTAFCLDSPNDHIFSCLLFYRTAFLILEITTSRINAAALSVSMILLLPPLPIYVHNKISVLMWNAHLSTLLLVLQLSHSTPSFWCDFQGFL